MLRRRMTDITARVTGASLLFMAAFGLHCSGETILAGDAQDGREDAAPPDAPVDLPGDDAEGLPCPDDCEDLNPCTSDACVDGSCVHAPVPDGSSCDPGELCPAGGVCEGGLCSPLPRPEEGSILWTRPLQPPDHGTAVLREPGGDLIVLSSARAERLRQDGSVVWSVPAYLSGNLGQLESLIVGDVVVTAQYDEMVGLDIGTGGEIWRSDAGGYIDSTVLGIDGLVVVSSVNLMSGPFMLRAYVPDSGAEVWGFEVDVRIGEMAATADGIIYASNGGQSDSPGYVLGLLPDGSELFRTEITNWGRPWISVDYSGAAVLTYPFVRVGPGGEILTPIGEYMSQMEAVISPDGSIVIVGDNADAVLRWLGRDGEVRAEHPIGDNSLNHPLVDACGIVYFLTYHGTITAVGPGGKLRWSAPVGSPEIVESVPDLSDDGVLFVATFDTLYAIQAAGAPLADTSWPRFRADSQSTAGARR
jgi:outer membrane protein assembly factor BamB